MRVVAVGVGCVNSASDVSKSVVTSSVCFLPKVNSNDVATLENKPDTMMEFFFRHLEEMPSEAE